MKKTTISLAVLAAAMLAATNAGASEFDGSYVGIKAGSNRSSASGASSASTEGTHTYGLEAGYGWDKGDILLGVDGFYDRNNNTTHNPLVNYGTNVYGLGLKLGIPMNRFMPYAKLGFARTDGRGDASTFGGDDLHGGVGLEYKLSSNWSLAGEWTRSTPSESGTKIKNDNFTIGLNYYFKAPQSAPVVAKPVAAVAEEPKAQPAPAAAPAPAPQESWKTVLTEKPVRLDGAHFAFDSSKLLPGADERLNEVVQAANRYPEVQLDVSGHTDSTGPRAHNQKLSESRAAAVKAWLVKHGIAADRIATAGYADTQPVADNKTREGRAANRRVEVRYVIREEKKVRVTK